MKSPLVVTGLPPSRKRPWYVKPDPTGSSPRAMLEEVSYRDVLYRPTFEASGLRDRLSTSMIVAVRYGCLLRLLAGSTIAPGIFSSGMLFCTSVSFLWLVSAT